jgi:hypothetical protein
VIAVGHMTTAAIPPHSLRLGNNLNRLGNRPPSYIYCNVRVEMSRSESQTRWISPECHNRLIKFR